MYQYPKAFLFREVQRKGDKRHQTKADLKTQKKEERERDMEGGRKGGREREIHSSTLLSRCTLIVFHCPHVMCQLNTDIFKSE